jgi:hypothetical protein
MCIKVILQRSGHLDIQFHQKITIMKGQVLKGWHGSFFCVGYCALIVFAGLQNFIWVVVGAIHLFILNYIYTDTYEFRQRKRIDGLTAAFWLGAYLIFPIVFVLLIFYFYQRRRWKEGKDIIDNKPANIVNENNGDNLNGANEKSSSFQKSHNVDEKIIKTGGISEMKGNNMRYIIVGMAIIACNISSVIWYHHRSQLYSIGDEIYMGSMRGVIIDSSRWTKTYKIKLYSDKSVVSVDWMAVRKGKPNNE